MLTTCLIVYRSLGETINKQASTRHHTSFEEIPGPVSKISFAVDSITLLGPLLSHKHCSFELVECQATGPLRLPGNSSCFALCLGPLVGCRSCCAEGECFEATDVSGPWGKCERCSAAPGPNRSRTFPCLYFVFRIYDLSALCPLQSKRATTPKSNHLKL